jgi:hypothetical protein
LAPAGVVACQRVLVPFGFIYTPPEMRAATGSRWLVSFQLIVGTFDL